MEKLILTVKDSSKLRFVLELLQQLDFVEIQKKGSVVPTNKKYDLFQLVGIWKDKEINSQSLREKAWKRVC